MEDKISRRTKWSYCVGNIGRDMNFILVSLFVLVYIQYTMNLTVSQFSVISGIMVFARVWDAINDPMMGMLIENKKLKGGKYKPWVLLGGVLNFFVTLMMFTLRPSGWAFVIFFGVVYIAWGMTFTINDISYYSLLPNLTSSNKTRNEFTNLLQLFASIGQILAGGLIPVLVTGNAIFMYRLIGIFISFTFLTFTLITYFGVTENKLKEEKKEDITFKKMFSIIKNNDQLVIAAISLLVFTVASELFVAFSMNYFYFSFGYGGDYLFYFTITFAVGVLSALGIFSVLSKKYSRMKILTMSLISMVVGYVLFILLGTVIPMITYLLYFSTFLVFLGNGLFFVILVVFIANTIEYNAVKFGERNDAIIFSVRPFMSKLGAALQQIILTLVLILSGVYSYSREIANLEIKKNSGELLEISMQANEILSNATEYMKFMLKFGMAIIPLILTIVAYLLIKKRYIITEEKFEEYVNILENEN